MVACAALLLSRAAAAQPPPVDPPKPPIFDGHKDLSIHTKEASAEASFTRLGDGSLTASGGLAVSAFYTPWLSLLGGATFSPGIGGARQTYDTRGVARLIYPEPLLGPVFLYAALGATVFFYEDKPPSYTRSFGLVGGLGAFMNLGERLRLRLEARDHWLLTNGDGMRHNMFFTLAFVTLIR